MAALEYFTVISHGLASIEADYVDPDTHPDEDIIFAFVDFIPREPPATTHWLSGLTPPRGIQLDPIRARYSPEDGKLRTIISAPTNEKQTVTPGSSSQFKLTYAGQTTADISKTADPGAVQAALEALPNINPGDVYVYRTTVNEKQTVTFSGAPTGGTFTLTFGGQTTTSVSRNANAGTLQQALQALSSFGPNECSVTGPNGGPWIVEFTGSLAGTDVALMTANSAGLTPSGTVVVTQTRAGSSTAPWQVNFVGALQGTDVAQMTVATGDATIATAIQGAANEGVELVANTPVLGLDELIYDVVITVPDADPLREDRTISPFAIAAPTTGGVTIDLADNTLHLPPKPR